MNKIKYTIAIPTFNNQATIAKTIISAANQRCDFDYEVVIVNNASTDDTAKIINDLISKYATINFKVVNNVETVSLFENHNVCLSEASGDYVLFCHSDDILFDDALSKIDTALKSVEYPSRIVCFGRSFFRDFGNAYQQGAQINNILAGVAVQEAFQNGGLTPSGTCYSRESFLESGGFLPMRSRLTPSDMSSMILYSLSGAEFLMMDRIIFMRKEASTAHTLDCTTVLTTYQEALAELRPKISESDFTQLLWNLFNFKQSNVFYFLSLFGLIDMSKSTSRMLKIHYIRCFKKNAFFIIRNMKLLRLFIKI